MALGRAETKDENTVDSCFSFHTKAVFQKKDPSIELLSEITSLLQTNEPSKIWDLCSDDLKTKMAKQGFFDIVTNINQALVVNDVKKISSLPKTQSSKTSIIKGKIINNHKTTYTIATKHFRKNSRMLGIKSISN